MLGDGAPLPVTAETPARILRTVEKENSYGGRRLSSATISKGGVTVRGRGTLEVLDGGSLEIVTGNLKLLAGTLPATALKNHIWVTMSQTARVPVTAQKGWRIGQWHKVGGVEVTAPDWAKTGIIFAVCLYKGHVTLDVAESDYIDARIRSVIGGISCPEYSAFISNYADFTWIHLGTMDCQPIPVTPGQVVRVDLEHTLAGEDYVFYDRGQAEITALALWMG